MKTTEENMRNGFQKTFESFEIKPSNGVWKSVHRENIRLGNTQVMSLSSKLFYFATALTIIVSVIYFINQKNSSQDKMVNNNNVESIENMTIVTTPSQEEPIFDNQEVVKEEQPKSNEQLVVADIGNQDEAVEHEKIQLPVKKIDIIPIVESDQNIQQNPIENNIDSVKSLEENIKSTEIIVLSPKSTPDTLNVKFGENPIVCFGEDAILTIEEGYEYSWNTGDYDNQLIVSPVESKSYYVTVSNQKGISTTHEFFVTVDNTCSAVFVPSAFTPNGDGNNDVFKVVGRGITSMNMVILSKTGQVVFESTHIDQTWDGKFKGELLAPDFYFYQINYFDAKGVSHTKRGQLTLIR